VSYTDSSEQFDDLVVENLRERQRLLDSPVRKLYSRRSLEQGFLECFEMVGGVPRLVAWAHQKQNYGEFLKLLMKFVLKERQEQTGHVIHYVSSVPGSPLCHPIPQADGSLILDQPRELVEPRTQDRHQTLDDRNIEKISG
jgi:hypothetical protein